MCLAKLSSAASAKTQPWQSRTRRVDEALRTGIPYTVTSLWVSTTIMLQEASTCRAREKVFFPCDLSVQFGQCAAHPDERDLFEVSGGGSVMVSSSSRAAGARVAIAVAIALQSVNTSEASRCQLL